MSVIGRPRSFAKKQLFVVEVDGLGSASFSKCSELSMEVNKAEHWEGGRRIAYTSPARVTFSDVTLERGATLDRDLYDWMTQVFNAAAGVGFVDDLYKRNVDLVQQDLDGRTLRRWSMFRAWPVKFVAGEWDNASDDVVIESVVLTYEFFQLVQRSRS